ncbi:hypothetical protein [Stenotrophomonas maltophilia]|uniref:Uncharacterized protein n=1 Tax=Stenotrophomonas maltophilia TaxID=40324 RepID=A0A4S2D189_STEMA|nr:hypothetical protein [Stenotrophomonas maltophilia]TGY35227.1 hypothetical protein E5352_05770 [Stenotrophomonas maltophilia]
MSIHTAHDLDRNAQRSWDGLEDPRFESELAGEQAADLVPALRADPAACREAEQWVAGTFDGEHYTEVTLALHQLHHTAPSDLIDSPLLAQLYALAAVEAAAMDEQLLEMATQQVAA